MSWTTPTSTLLLLMVTSGVCGCIGVPVPHKEKALADSRRVITTQESQFIQPAHTSREEVLLRLGEPRWRLRQDHVFAYEWTTSKFNMLWLDLTPIAWGVPLIFPRSNELGLEHYLLIEFDDRGLAKRFEVKDATWLRVLSPEEVERNW